MTYLVERLVELQRHRTHLGELGPRVSDRFALERDLDRLEVIDEFIGIVKSMQTPGGHQS